MLKVFRDKIMLTRGNTAVISIALSDAAGEPYEPGPGDRLVFGMRKTLYSEDYALYKEITGNELRIEPGDTAQLSCGSYVYDIQLSFAGGDICTVIPCAEFEIMPEVVRNG